MNFASDNWAGAHPMIAQRLFEASAGFSAPYGTSEQDHRIEQRFSELFERDVAVYFVSTGTAGNSLLSTDPAVSLFVTEKHTCWKMNVVRLSFLRMALAGLQLMAKTEKIDSGNLKAEIRRFPPNFIHADQPMGISITQATEIGTVNLPDKIAEIAEIAKYYQLPLHMDGARFANALVALNLSPVDMTWKLGVDFVSFGTTKNGCWCADALVL